VTNIALFICGSFTCIVSLGDDNFIYFLSVIYLRTATVNSTLIYKYVDIKLTSVVIFYVKF